MVGQRLFRVVVVLASVSVAFLGGQGARADQVYTVEPGDTPVSVASAYGVGVQDLINVNGIVDPQNLLVGSQLTIPVADSESVASWETVIPNIPAYQQSRSLSCEYASVFIATSAFGAPIYEGDYLWATPQSANPHFGFRGNIDGAWGNTVDYGIYAEALVPTLNRFGYVGEVSYGADADLLRAQLDAGRPTIVWLAFWGDTGYYESDETGTYKLVAGEHVGVAYGYDEGGVHFSDPGSGIYRYFDWASFLSMWSVMDGMSLAVYPAY